MQLFICTVYYFRLWTFPTLILNLFPTPNDQTVLGIFLSSAIIPTFSNRISQILYSRVFATTEWQACGIYTNRSIEKTVVYELRHSNLLTTNTLAKKMAEKTEGGTKSNNTMYYYYMVALITNEQMSKRQTIGSYTNWFSWRAQSGPTFKYVYGMCLCLSLLVGFIYNRQKRAYFVC